MRLVIVSFSFARGGAGIAAHKFRNLIYEQQSEFAVNFISQDDASKGHFLKRLVSFFLVKLQLDGNSIKHSLNLFSYSPLVKLMEEHPADVYNLHWINNDTLSIFDFDKVPAGSIITLHDEWLYCGSEHCYKLNDFDCDFVDGYNFLKKGVYGIHWNYLIWLVKKNKLIHRKDIIYTVPSTWMYERARSSFILKNADVRYLPNPIDTQIFRPMPSSDVNAVRRLHVINENDVVICFGAIGGKKNPLKGAFLLESALLQLKDRLTEEQMGRIKLLDFGGASSESYLYGFRSISLGYISDPEQLALLYSSVDCMVVPSMVESFGQVAAEALACGTPVVCFDTSGLRDVVHHEKTGLVAEAFNSESLADQLFHMIDMSSQERENMGKAGREHVVSKFSFPVISDAYFKIVHDAADMKLSRH